MNITLKLFATLSDYLPEHAKRNNQVVLELPPESTVAQVISRFSLPEKLVHLVLVNGTFVPHEERLSHPLKEGDALAIWPPVAGG